jgi:hypothetical protein
MHVVWDGLNGECELETSCKTKRRELGIPWTTRRSESAYSNIRGGENKNWWQNRGGTQNETFREAVFRGVEGPWGSSVLERLGLETFLTSPVEGEGGLIESRFDEGESGSIERIRPDTHG